jgi:outer membrane protein assembly factor BamA
MTVGAAAQYERRDRLGRLFVNTPSLFGRGIQSSLILERSRAESPVDTFVTDLTTTAWEQRGHRGPLSLSYGLRFERNRTFDTNPDPILPFDLTVHIGSLTASATWDTRDDPSDSRRGTFVSTSIEHASDALGSDLLFVRTLTQAYHFRLLKQVVLASAVRYGSLNPLRGQELQISSLLFFAGGARTIRGVAEDSVRGVDFLGNPIGGKGLLTLNQEMRFPVYRWLRGVAFVDSGNVFEEATAVRLRELVGSAGVGVRFVTPLVLLRVDYGKTIWNKPVSDTGRWVFGIGQTF